MCPIILLEDQTREISSVHELCGTHRASLDLSFYLYYSAPVDLRAIKALEINKITVYMFCI